ncbi:MAG TPA: hypothetical protein DEO59_11550 [Balneola sp.]|nr:hypothetical protein [Balneola sp.]
MVITFKIGDLLIDVQAGEIGLLMSRFDIIKQPKNPVWAWEILWCGAHMVDIFRMQAYTESGLYNMVEVGLMKHCGVNDK